VNESGRRIGETHHNALLADALVDQMRDRHEDEGLGYRRIAREFGVALTTVRKICTYERRAQTAVRWKTIRARKPALAELFDGLATIESSVSIDGYAVTAASDPTRARSAPTPLHARR
jgi:hypothetical protein